MDENNQQKIYDTKLIFCATGISHKQGQFEGSPQKPGGDMDMSHCEYARDEADDNSMSAFEHFLKTPGSKELSL